MPRFFHVTSSRNRGSIGRHGLDWTRMGGLLGATASPRPEAGVFLCRDEGEVEFFCRRHANGGPVDVWAVEDINEGDLVEAPEGFVYLPRPIPPERLILWHSERLPGPTTVITAPTTAYQRTLTIALGDGRVLHDAEAREWVRREQGTAE